MANALQLLRGEQYELPTGQFGQPGPQSGGGSPAMALAGPPPMPAGQPMAQPVAETPPMEAESDMGMQPEAPTAKPRPGMPEWMTPERKAMYERAKRAAGNYRKAVDKRRTMRKHAKQYSQMYNKHHQLRESIATMENMLQTYPELFRQDDPRYLNMTRDMTKRFEESEALKGQMQDYLKRYGVKLGKDGALPEDPFGEAGDDQFDQFIQQGYTDAMMSPY